MKGVIQRDANQHVGWHDFGIEELEDAMARCLDGSDVARQVR